MHLRSTTTRIGLTALLVALVAGLSASARGQPAGNAVTEWNLIAVNTLAAMPGAAGGAGPAIQINLAMTQGAVYDAVNAIEPRHHRPYLLKRRFSARASKEAAVATAAYRVLASIVATVPATIPFPGRASLLQSLAAQYAASLAAIPNTPFKRQGIAAGNAAAEAIITARENDGRFGPSQWVPNAAPGHWQPLLNSDGTQMLDPTPWVGGVRPFRSPARASRAAWGLFLRGEIGAVPIGLRVGDAGEGKRAYGARMMAAAVLRTRIQFLQKASSSKKRGFRQARRM